MGISFQQARTVVRSVVNSLLTCKQIHFPFVFRAVSTVIQPKTLEFIEQWYEFLDEYGDGDEEAAKVMFLVNVVSWNTIEELYDRMDEVEMCTRGELKERLLELAEECDIKRKDDRYFDLEQFQYDLERGGELCEFEGYYILNANSF